MRELARAMLMVIGLVLALLRPSWAWSASDYEHAVRAQTLVPTAAVVPGQAAWLAVKLQHAPGWHTYWKNPGDSGLPTQLAWRLPAGWTAEGIAWPTPRLIALGPFVNYGYESDVVLPVRVHVPADTPVGQHTVRATASWLMCREVCVPGEAEVSWALRVDKQPPAGPAPSDEIAKAVAALPVARGVSGRFLRHEGRVWAWLPAEGVASVGVPALLIPEVERQVQASAQQVRMAPSHAMPKAVARAVAGGGKASSNGAAAGWLFELTVAEDAAASWSGSLEVLLIGESAVPYLGDHEVSHPSQAVARLTLEPMAERLANAVLAVVSTSSAGGHANDATVMAPMQMAIAERSAAAGGGGLLQASATSAASSAGGGTTLPSPSASTNPTSGGGFGVTSGWLWSLIAAAIGGVLLNLMPCVFPVVGLKLLALAHPGGDAASARATQRRGVWAYCAGVLVSFWVLAGAMLLLRAGGTAIGWGFQLQSPGFVSLLAGVFVLLGLNLAGVFEVGLGLAARAGQADFEGSQNAQKSGSWWPSFASGVLASLVATPCSAPLMGAAVGYTLAADWFESLTVFTALGLGMAMPYWVLGIFPSLLKYLPKPGAWMLSLRQLLSFPMFAASAWLVWVVGEQLGVDAVLPLLLSCVLVALAAWIYGKFLGGSWAARPGWACVFFMVLGMALYLGWPDSLSSADQGGVAASGNLSTLQSDGSSSPKRDANAIDPAILANTKRWHPWSKDLVTALQAQGKPVFVDFTAAWCVSCQVNKRLVLEKTPVVEAMAKHGVVKLRADWTQKDDQITRGLAEFGRNGVPLYVYYPPDAQQTGRPALVLPEVLTQGQVLALFGADSS